MRRRFFAFAAFMLVAGVATPTLVKADAAAASAKTVAAAPSVAPSWCIQTALDPGHCQYVPCPIAKYCPEVGSQPSTEAMTAKSTSSSVAATPAAPATPAWYCSPTIQTACQVVGFVLCRKPFASGCPELAPATATQVAPRAAAGATIACAPGFQVVCTVLGVICRSNCEAASTTVGASATRVATAAGLTARR